jgi:hypothetical protein
LSFDVTQDTGGWIGGGIWVAGHDIGIVDNYIHNIPGAKTARAKQQDKFRVGSTYGNEARKLS